MSDGYDDQLQRFGAALGIEPEWLAVTGETHRLAPQALRRLIEALGQPVDDRALIEAAIAELEARRAPTDPEQLPPLLVAELGSPFALPASLAPRLAGGNLRLVSEEDEHICLAQHLEASLAVTLPEQPGYYRLEIGAADSGWVSRRLAVAPKRCFGADDRAPRWGVAAQLYSLRRSGDGGTGDGLALVGLVEAMAELGADAVAISPVHALFAAEPARISPYSPSSRQWRNPLYIAVDADDAAPGSSELIDWPAQAARKWPKLRAAWEAFERDDEPQARASFAAYRQEGGEALEDHCRFEALCSLEGLPGDWRRWPPSLRDPRAPEVAAWAVAHASEITFHAYAQWRMAMELERAQRRAREAGMAIGLVNDLAVGADPGGSQAWSRRDQLLDGATIGAPPDAFSPRGQGWGVAAFSPFGLEAHGYGAFIDMLRAAMRGVGAIRIDHVMGQARLWLLPEGGSPMDGAYLRYPFETLMRLIALESHRAGVRVIGEDLGTVPPGFREWLDRFGVLGMQVVWFERDAWIQLDDGSWVAGFAPAERYSARAAALSSTHDLPTVAGWWLGRDIDWRERLGLIDDVGSERQARARDRAALVRMLGLELELEDRSAEGVARLIDALLVHLARTPSPLVLVQIEDLLGLEEQANLPGTIDQHPNWRRRLPIEVDALRHDPRLRARAALLARRPDAMMPVRAEEAR